MTLDLPRHPVFFGHPLHAILSDGPAVLIPAAFVIESARTFWPSRNLRDTSDVACAAALAAGVAAAGVGWIDWLTMPREHPAQKPGTVHGFLNSAAVVAVLGAAAARSWRLPLLAGATAAVAVGGWLGGELVFRHGWRVRPAEEAELVDQDLRKAGLGGYFRRARARVSDFERRRTFTAG